jgi:hypothetical protein
MRAMDVASANIQPRAHPALDLALRSEPVATSRDSDDIRNRIHPSHLMKVDCLYRNIMYLRLCVPEQPKRIEGHGLGSRWQSRTSNHPLNHRQRTPMHVLSFVRVWMCVLVFMLMRVIRGLTVWMRV